MKRSAVLPLLAAVAWACQPDDPENSAICGITLLASANRVLERLPNAHALLSEAPEELTRGTVPARVVGYGTTRALAAAGPDGAVLQYRGEGFPPVPGFAVALVDDSSEVLRGVLIFEPEPPQGYPHIGAVAGAQSVLPLLGLRINWGSVNSERCPLFSVADSGGP